MNKEMTVRADHRYQEAERKAAAYYETLYKQFIDKTYVSLLTEDILLWKKDHVRENSIIQFLKQRKKTPNSNDYYQNMKWLHYTGKLDDYLDRSVSYIYMRDLGKALDDPHTQIRIQRLITDIKKYLLTPGTASDREEPDFINFASFYRWAQKERVENATIWVMNKLKRVSAHIPKEMDAEQAQRKLMKIIIGVVLHVMEEMADEVSPEERAERLDAAIRLGYSYGLTYPFIDDLLDSDVLSNEEKEQYSEMIRISLLTGSVPDLEEWTGTNLEMIQYVHSELREAFEFIRDYQRADTQATFLEQSYVFFQSQDQDRIKDLSNGSYTNEEIYLPIIIKSSSSRLIVRSVISEPMDEGFENRTFAYGIYNQLADDFADMFDDLGDGAVTPYTYYLTYRHQRPDLINPFELYWAVISNLIRNVYHSDAKTREVILDRAINGLKRCKKRVGSSKYNEIMDIFTSSIPEFNRLIQQMVGKAEDVDFFDKLLRDQLLTVMKKERLEKEEFLNTINTAQTEINRLLKISKPAQASSLKEPLTEAANYSLAGGGKRIRPVMAWVMAVKEYGLHSSAIAPLLRSLEYMHTASLIFDDLPTQDNAATRRGHATLHEVYNSATAELTGLFLIQKATQEQSSLDAFDPKSVLALMQYSSQKAGEMCMGQAMDLESKGKELTLDELNTICFYKTGIAFEASLIMPAILANVEEKEIATLKKFAYHAGIAFQIKDDLLDLQGDLKLLGKPTGKDVQNNNSTFVTVLGADGAAQAMWEHYCLAVDALKEMPRNSVFLKHILDYIIHRDH